MSFGSFFRSIGRVAAPTLRITGGAVAGTVRSAGRIPGVSMLPGIGTAIGLAGAGLSLYDSIKGSGSNLPALPNLEGAPMSPGGFGGGLNPKMGKRTILGNDPNLPDQLKPYAISKGNLRMFYRAPKGFVIRHDAVGDAYGIPKTMAKAYLGWKPAKKPLLSIRDTQAIKHAGHAIKKLQAAEKMAKKIANWHSPHKAAPRNIIVTGKRVK